MKTGIYTGISLCFLLLFFSFFSSCNTVNNKGAASLVSTPIQGIKFIEEDWNAALVEAKNQHKLIFLDIYASWCGPCKLLKQSTFQDQTVALYFNKNCINISVDGEKGMGPLLASQFEIEGYPALIIADQNGKMIAKSIGYLSKQALINFGKAGLEMK